MKLQPFELTGEERVPPAGRDGQETKAEFEITQIRFLHEDTKYVTNLEQDQNDEFLLRRQRTLYLFRWLKFLN